MFEGDVSSTTVTAGLAALPKRSKTSFATIISLPSSPSATSLSRCTVAVSDSDWWSTLSTDASPV